MHYSNIPFLSKLFYFAFRLISFSVYLAIEYVIQIAEIVQVSGDGFFSGDFEDLIFKLIKVFVDLKPSSALLYITSHN